MFIDTHAHLNYPEIAQNINEVLSRAIDSGVEKIIVPATSYKSSLEVIELVRKHEMLYGAVGIHPTELTDFNEKKLQEIESLCSEEKIVAVGEIGLDYFWEPYDKELQNYVLSSQLQIAKKNNLPVILHNRSSSEDLMKIIINEYDNGNLRGQFHSFSGDSAMAKKCIELGFYISFTGNITYKPNDSTYTAYDIIKNTEPVNLLLETDTPYLPPMPYRGKKNEPSYLKYTAAKIAQLKEMEISELGEITSKNAEILYNLQ